MTWEEYELGTRNDDGQVDESVARLRKLPVGALVWTRRRDSSCWLGEITGCWEYHGDEQARSLDMFNLRPCRWRRVGTEDSVPGKVVNNFRARRTLNPVADGAAVRYTRRQFGQLTDRAGELKRIDPRELLGSLLGPADRRSGSCLPPGPLRPCTREPRPIYPWL